MHINNRVGGYLNLAFAQNTYQSFGDHDSLEQEIIVYLTISLSLISC